MRLLARRLCDRLRHPHDNVWHFINAALVILVLALLARDYNYQSQFSAPQPESVLDVVARSGVLRVGSPLDYAPFAWTCGGAAVGSDVDLARGLANELSAELRFVPTTWAALVDDFLGGSFDMAVGGVTPTLERMRHVAFSTAHLSDSKVAVARCDAAGRALLQAIAAGGDRLEALIEGGRTAPAAIVNAGGTNEAVLRAAFGSVRTVARNGAQFDALLGGKADLTVTDDIELRVQTRRRPGALCASAPLVIDGFVNVQGKAFVLPRDDLAFKMYVDRWVDDEIYRGALNASVEGWIEAAARGGCTTDGTG